MTGLLPPSQDLDVIRVPDEAPVVPVSGGLQLNSRGNAEIILTLNNGGRDLIGAANRGARSAVLDFTGAAARPASPLSPECLRYGSDRASINPTILPNGQMEIRIPTNSTSAMQAMTPGARGAGRICVDFD